MFVSLDVTGFTGPYASLNGARPRFPLTKLDLILGVVTVGRSSWTDVFTGGAARWVEMCGLGLQMSAYLEQGPAGLRVSGLFRRLDRSEKTGASYRIGMGAAKVIAERLLRVRWLQHVDPLVRSRVATLSTGSGERGDLTGQDTRRKWHVVEAKARSWWADSALKIQAKVQAARILSVDGAPPATTCSSVASLFPDPIEIAFSDPENHLEEYEPTSLLLDFPRFLNHYYAPVIFLRESGVEFRQERLGFAEGVEFMSTPLGLPELRLGVHRNLYELLQPGRIDWDEVVQVVSRWSEQWDRFPMSGLASLGPDGYAIFGSPA